MFTGLRETMGTNRDLPSDGTGPQLPGGVMPPIPVVVRVATVKYSASR